MNAKEIVTNENQITVEITNRTDELLHMILDLKQDKEVDLYRMQSLVLNMYKEEIELFNLASELEKELENRKRKVIEIPNFMSKKEAH